MAGARIQLKRATAAAWAAANTVLLAGEIGLETDTNKFKIGNGSTAFNSLSYFNGNLAGSSLNDLADVTIVSAADGDFLRWNGTAWINDAVNLSTDTIGSYVQSLVAGTGVTLTNNSGEGATPTVAIGQSVGTGDSPTFVNVTASLTGNASTATTLQTARNIAGQAFNGSANISIAPTDLTGVTSTAAELNILDGATLSTTELNYVDGVTSAIQTQIDTKAPLASPTFTGTVTLPSGTVTSAMIADGTIVNADISSSAEIVDSKLATISTAGKVSNSATTATANAGNSTIVARDASGNFAAGTITAALSGNASTATTLATTRAIEISGDVTGTANFDGSAAINITATIAANSVALGTDTTGSYVTSLVAGTGVTLTNNSGEGATPTIAIGQAVATNSNVTFNDLTVSGNLTVSGTTTSINTETVTVDDNIIILNNNATGAPSVDAGIEIERGSSTNVVLRWNETSDKWETTNDGTTYGNIVTTADSGTVTSAMITDGTIVDGDISASAAIAYSKLANATPGQVLLGTTTSGVVTATALSGDVTVNGAGVTTIGSGKVTSDMIVDGTIVNADINASAAIVDTKLSTIATAGKVSNSATTATDANTASAIVARDASGNFAAGTITAALTGNASTATTLATSRNIAGQSFNGSANISIAPTDLTGVTSTAAEINILDGATLSTTELNYVDGVTSAIQTQIDTKAPLASPTFTGTVTLPSSTVTSAMIADATIVDGDISSSAAIADSKLATIATAGKVSNSATTATATAGNSTIVARDASGNFAAGTITAALSGNASTASALATTRAIEISGDVTGTANFDGSAAINIVTTIAANSVALGTDTTGNYVNDITAGTGVTVTHTPGEGTSPTIAIGQAVATNSNVTFNDLTVSGNLTVSGTTTSINTETLTVNDNIVILNNNVTGSPTENAGIEVERGTSANVSVRWNEANDKWEVTNDGTTYGNVVSTSDSGTVATAMIADSNVTTGKINDLAITNAKISESAAIVDTKLATISTAGKVSNSATTATDANTANAIVARDASGNFTAGTITGALSGNASTATTLATARNIAGQSFNGSANISIAPTDLTGVTATAAQINILNGATLSTTELNYVDGVTSAIQTQLDAKAPLASPTFTGTPTLPTGTIAVTQTLGNNTTAVATTAFIQTALANFGGMTVSDTAPASGDSGDFWWDSTGLNLYIYYSNNWVQVSSEDPVFFELSELLGVEIGNDLSPNHTLRFDGTSGNWVNSAPRQTVGTITTTSYSVSASDSGKVLLFNNASATNVNLGSWSANVGEKVDIVRYGTGQVTVTVSGSVVTISPSNSVTTRAQYSLITATCVAANTFLLSGDLT